MKCMNESIDNFIKFREKEGKDLKKNLIFNLKKLILLAKKSKKFQKNL